MKGLFLDDERNPQDVTWVDYPQGIEWRVVRTFDAFVAALEENGVAFELISFDHDLQDFDASGVERTGYTCMKWLSERSLDTETPPPALFHVHSMNGPGGGNIRSLYSNLLDHFSKASSHD